MRGKRKRPWATVRLSWVWRTGLPAVLLPTAEFFLKRAISLADRFAIATHHGTHFLLEVLVFRAVLFRGDSHGLGGPVDLFRAGGDFVQGFAITGNHG